ncbi:MAG: rRNA maturation RNase YbeY [Candidatus Cloacimonadota bacterium]|nr:MAG: rRNA maturation RNase YbeY [Candidatus Cloacimonadota bacterium]PIE77791.1 MAG: rRNA maturation RNase YbeY [Candidatus Delongbacteria bacterium]
MNITILNETKSKIVKTKIKNQISIFADLYNREVDSLSISYIGDENMIKLNNDYLNHEGSTDIITFDYSEEESNIIDGELIICVDQAKRQARDYKVLLENELTRLLYHGLLHLEGFNDSTNEEREVMREKENQLLALWYGDK